MTRRRKLPARAGWLETRAPTVEALLAALARAETFAEERPVRARAVMSRRFSLGPALEVALWRPFRHRRTMPQSLLPLMEGQARLLARKGDMESASIPNVLDLLYLRGLNAVRPQAVTVVR